MEVALGLLHTALKQLWDEAQRVTENREALQQLAQKAKYAVEPLLRAAHAKLQAVAHKEHVNSSLSHLHASIRSVFDLICKRGQPQGALNFVRGAIGNKGAKIKAEIEGAERDLFQSVHCLMLALQIEGMDQKLSGHAAVGWNQSPYVNNLAFPTGQRYVLPAQQGGADAVLRKQNEAILSKNEDILCKNDAILYELQVRRNSMA